MPTAGQTNLGRTSHKLAGPFAGREYWLRIAFHLYTRRSNWCSSFILVLPQVQTSGVQFYNFIQIQHLFIDYPLGAYCESGSVFTAHFNASSTRQSSPQPERSLGSPPKVPTKFPSKNSLPHTELPDVQVSPPPPPTPIWATRSPPVFHKLKSS